MYSKKAKFYADSEPNWFRVFQRIPEITGMELRLCNKKWEGRYYLNGARHPYKKDKLRIGLWNNNIWLHEQGGQSMSLSTWLVNYGGASDYKHAYSIIRGEDRPLLHLPDFIEVKKEVSYVPWSVVDVMRRIDLRKCPLFRWMCTLFPEDRVRDVWEMYNVTTDSKGLAVFWYADAEGRVCHDKRVRFMENGHRDKSFGGTREYRTAEGFTARPYFGAHLVKDECVNIVESEKSAILGCLSYGGVWLATGGKGNLKDVTNAKLYPDVDAVSEWSQKGSVVEWWQGWHEVGATSDIGDYIVWNIEHNQKQNICR